MNQLDKKPRVLLVNSAIYLPGEGGHKRSLYLFEMMTRLGYDVTLLTSNFNHYAKKIRDIEKFRAEYPSYRKIEFIKVLPYKKNIGIARILSNKLWKIRFKKWFSNNANKFDVIYHNMPAMDTILAAQPLSEKYKHKVVIDVRDLRPEVFKVILKNDLLYKVLTYFIKKKADKAYSCADLMFAVSEEYLKRGMSVNTKAIDSRVVYIGSILDKFYHGIELYKDSIEKPLNEVWITYAGTIGNTYDLYTLMDAAKKIEKEGYLNVRFKILGQGPLEKELKQYVEFKDISNVDFVGFVPYEKMAAYLSMSDMTVNSLKARASQSIINKVADYFAAGIPMLNGSLCKEMQDMVDNYKVGINFTPENVDSLVESIVKLLNHPEQCAQYGANAILLAKNKFDRQKSYMEIIERIDMLYNK